MRLEEDQDCWVCDYCRNIYFPEKNDDGVRVLGEPSRLACPVCQVALLTAAIEHQRLLYCDRCRGMLISMNVLPGLVEALRAQAPDGAALVPRAADPNALRRHSDCPQCHRPMDTHLYGGPGNVVIDSCSVCYLNWLDTGELWRMVRAPDRKYGEDA